MRVLGLDLGTKTLGIAISDKTNKIASPYTVIRYNDYDTLINELISIIKLESITNLALGLPKNMDNSLGFAAQRSTEFAKLIQDKIDINIAFIDERLSTKEAENILIDGNVKRIKRKKVIDALAATIILENYLNRKGE